MNAEDADMKKAKQKDPTEAELLAGYGEMAADVEHEREAMEWCEALIGDALADD
jgi:hypothetical protein